MKRFTLNLKFSVLEGNILKMINKMCLNKYERKKREFTVKMKEFPRSIFGLK